MPELALVSSLSSDWRDRTTSVGRNPRSDYGRARGRTQRLRLRQRQRRHAALKHQTPGATPPAPPASNDLPSEVQNLVNSVNNVTVPSGTTPSLSGNQLGSQSKPIEIGVYGNGNGNDKTSKPKNIGVGWGSMSNANNKYGNTARHTAPKPTEPLFPRVPTSNLGNKVGTKGGKKQSKPLPSQGKPATVWEVSSDDDDELPSQGWAKPPPTPQSWQPSAEFIAGSPSYPELPLPTPKNNNKSYAGSLYPQLPPLPSPDKNNNSYSHAGTGNQVPQPLYPQLPPLASSGIGAGAPAPAPALAPPQAQKLYGQPRPKPKKPSNADPDADFAVMKRQMKAEKKQRKQKKQIAELKQQANDQLQAVMAQQMDGMGAGAKK